MITRKILTSHRQELTRLMINSISLNGSVVASKADVEEEKAVPVEVVAE